MTVSGDIPRSDKYRYEVPLDKAEVMALRDDVIWPAANQAWGGDFLHESNHLESAVISRKRQRANGLARFALKLECWLDSGDDDLEDADMVRSATLSIAEHIPELNRELHKAAGFVTHETEEWDDDDNENAMQAWRVTKYIFEVPSDAMVNKFEEYQLWDHYDEVAWNDREETISNITDELDEEVRKQLDEVLEGYIDAWYETITYRDIRNIIEAIAGLGMLRDTA